MIPTIGMQSTSRSLPPLGGRLLGIYRVLWLALAAATVGILMLSIIHPTAQPLIVGLRLLKAAIVLTVAAILFRRRQRDAVAALLSLVLMLWTVTSSFDFGTAEVPPMLLDRLRFFLFVLALLLFPDGSWRPGWTRAVAVSSAGVFMLGVGEGLRLVPTRLFLPLAVACVIAAVLALVSRFRAAQVEAVRQQLKWVALGLTAGIGLILLARSGALLSRHSSVLHSAGFLWEGMFQLGIAVVALGFLISLLRYRLFDAETAISRSATLAVLTIMLVATFAGTEATIEWAGQQYLGMGIGNISAAMAAAVAAVLLNPLHDRVSDWAERHFQRDLVLLKRELPELLENLGASATPPQLGIAVLSHVNEALHATRSALIASGATVIAANGVSLKDARRWSREWLSKVETLAQCDRDDCLFPIRVELPCPYSGKPGWVLLGPRPDGSIYGKDDLSAIEFVRPAIRNALARATNREALRKTTRRKWQSLLCEVVELRSRVRALEAGRI